MSEERGASDWQTHPWVTEGVGQVRLGIGVTARAPSPDWPTCLRLVQTLDDLGYDSFWQADHPAASHDCWLMLAALAPHTRRIRLGPLVSCASYRSPALLARQAADVDRLSGGRSILGVGAGWFEPEYRWLGLPFPTLRDRFQALRETVEVVHGLWATRPFQSEEEVEGAVQVFPHFWTRSPFTYEGTFNRFDQAILTPGPVQQPRVPILIGGSGEQVTLRLVARYADMANFEEGKARTPDVVRAKLDALRRHCDDLGRPFESVLPSYFVNGVLLAATREQLRAKVEALPPVFRSGSNSFGTPDDLIARLRPIVDAGMRYLVLNLTSYDDVETACLVMEQVLPALESG
jgi:alkanesulfonate monooxygenase SsuD/methylene tetrahydromethanopterin reductase-like flavin-dependent oxidoreductase (luciferase family)